MISFLSYLLLFLLPVILIVFVNMRRRRRIVFTHTLLDQFEDRSIRDFLFRFFHLYFDIVFDVLLALFLALSLSGVVSLERSKTAVCLDGSYSLLIGGTNSALDRAISQIQQKSVPQPNDLYILSYDPRRRMSRLKKINWLRRESLDPAAAKDKLVDRFTFFNNDLDRLSGLTKLGYRKVVLLTDSPPRKSDVETIDLQRTSSERLFYPLGHYDLSVDRFVITLYQQNLILEPQLRRFDQEQQDFVRYTEYSFAGGAAPRFSIADEGLYLLRGDNLDFVVALRRPEVKTAVNGDYARIILETLPSVQEDGDQLELVDRLYPAAGSKINLPPGKTPRIITFVPDKTVPDSGLYIHPLETTLSRPALSEYPAGLLTLPADNRTRIFYQNKDSLVDAQTPFAYLTALERLARERVTGKSVLLYQGQSSYLYRETDRRQRSALQAVNLAPEELFPIPPPELSLAGRPPQILLFVLLLGLYLLKLFFLRTYHRR